MAKRKQDPFKAYIEAQKQKGIKRLIDTNPGEAIKIVNQGVAEEEPKVEFNSLYQAIIIVYETLYRQLTLKPHFHFEPRIQEKVQIAKFIKWLNVKKHSRVNATFIISYFEFQFSYYDGILTPYGKNAILFNWIVGDLAKRRFESRNLNEKWLIRLKNKKVGLRLKEVLRDFRKPQKFTINKLYDFEESDKKRFYNTPKGLLYCLSLTTLYNPLSELCQNCSNQSDCKLLLKNIYPNLFELRGC